MKFSPKQIEHAAWYLQNADEEDLREIMMEVAVYGYPKIAQVMNVSTGVHDEYVEMNKETE